MTELGKKYLLFIEPKKKGLEPKVGGRKVRLLKKLLKGSQYGQPYKGWHECSCGERSSNQDIVLKDGTITNSLALHYLWFHRSEVPPSELAKIERMAKEFGIK